MSLELQKSIKSIPRPDITGCGFPCESTRTRIEMRQEDYYTFKFEISLTDNDDYAFQGNQSYKEG